MPTQVSLIERPGRAYHYWQGHDAVYRPEFNNWACATTMSRNADVEDGTFMQYRRKVTRTWVRSSPWPVAAGVLAPVNPYSVTREVDIHQPSRALTLIPEGSTPGACLSETHYFGDLGAATNGGCNVVPPFLDDARVGHLQGQAMLKFLLKVKDQKSQLIVSLAEGRQTLDMLSSTARAIADFRKRFLRKLSKAVRESPARVHSAWLQGRYGWMPLYYDMYGIASHLLEKKTQDIYPVRAFVKWESDSTNKFFYSGFTWKGTVATRDTHRYKCGVGGFVVVERRNSRELVRAGLTNPLEVLWELTPLSFVADWVVNIGDYIEGMTALTGVSLQNCWASTQTDRGQSARVIDNMPGLPWTVVLGTSNSCERQDYYRYPVSPSLLHVGLTDLVNYDLQLSWKRWVDAAALVRAAFTHR